MHALRIDNKFLDLGNNTLTLNMHCPLFDKERIVRTFSYPGKLDATAHNDHILKHARRLDSSIGKVKYECDLFLDGLFYETGVFTITETSNTHYKYKFTNKTLDIVEELSALKLSDLHHEVYIEPLYSPPIVASGGPPSAPIEGAPTHYAIEIDNVLYTGGVWAPLDFVAQLQAAHPGLVTIVQHNNFQLVLMFTIDPSNPVEIDFAPVSYADYWLFYSFPTNLDEVAIDNHREGWENHLNNVLNNNNSHLFIPFRNTFFFEENEEFLKGFFNYFNYYNDGYTQNTEAQENPIWQHSLIPFVKLQWVFSQIVINSSVGDFGGNFYNDQEIQTLLLTNNISLDLLVNNPVPPFDHYINIWKDRYNLSNHLPNISVFDFLQNLANDFCLFYRYNDNLWEMEPCKELLTEEIEDWTHLATPDYNAVKTDKKNITLGYNRDEDYPNFESQLEGVDGGKDAEEFIIEYDSMYDSIETDRVNIEREWRVPLVYDQGTSDAAGLSNEMKTRLLFYRGMQPDSEGNDYPFASHSNENFNGDLVGNYSLDWNGEYGRYENWFREYISIIQGNEVAKKMRFNIAELLKNRDFRNVRKRIWHRSGEMVGVLKSIQVKSYPNRRISEATIKFIQQS